jgi:hypothetical protein
LGSARKGAFHLPMRTALGVNVRYSRGNGPVAFGHCAQLGDMNRLDFQRGQFGVVELGMKCEVAHFLALRCQINQHLPVVTHPAVDRIFSGRRV